MAESENLQILADGRQRLVALHRPRIEAQIRARYERDLENASWVGKLRIALRIRAEIRRALDEVAPETGVY